MDLLKDIIVVDFCQFLSGPSASLRLADFGATVIKIEKPGSGDICRELYVSDVVIDGDSSIFHAINRNKKSYVADLKNNEDAIKIKKLITHADVVMHNFRPGVMERLGFSYKDVKKINPSVIYASVSGYGEEGEWRNLPGQDLLLQSLSGLSWLNNSNNENPTPMGVAVIDILSGAHMAQGILSLLYQRAITGEGGCISVSMFESSLDFQFEVLTSYYNDGNELPQRSSINSGHAYVGAPYGIYKTTDGYLALAMADIVKLGGLLSCEELNNYPDSTDWYEKRDEIKMFIADCLLLESTAHWLSILEPAGIWCSNVYNYDNLRDEEGYKALNMEIVITNSNGVSVTTTRSPFRVDGEVISNRVGAPLLGEHNKEIDEKYSLAKKVSNNIAITMQPES